MVAVAASGCRGGAVIGASWGDWWCCGGMGASHQVRVGHGTLELTQGGRVDAGVGMEEPDDIPAGDCSPGVELRAAPPPAENDPGQASGPLDGAVGATPVDHEQFA